MIKKQGVFIFIAVVVSLFPFACRYESKPEAKFHGMWTLDRHEIKDSTSSKWLLDSTRIGLTGFVIYDGLGHMGVQQIKAPGDTSQNNIDIIYFGKYSVLDANVIQHTKFSSSFDDVGASVRRRFEFKGDTLVLTPEEANGKLRIWWVKKIGS